MKQLTFDVPPLRRAEMTLLQTIEAEEPERLSLVREWIKFHRENPRVYELLERFTGQLVRRNRTHIGARLIWERMRWELTISTTDRTEFKLNDHYPPYYARLLMLHHPKWKGMFETRSSARGRGRRPKPTEEV